LFSMATREIIPSLSSESLFLNSTLSVSFMRTVRFKIDRLQSCRQVWIVPHYCDLLESIKPEGDYGPYCPLISHYFRSVSSAPVPFAFLSILENKALAKRNKSTGPLITRQHNQTHNTKSHISNSYLVSYGRRSG
jgi:hypothetical protein